MDPMGNITHPPENQYDNEKSTISRGISYIEKRRFSKGLISFGVGVALGGSSSRVFWGGANLGAFGKMNCEEL